MSERKDGLFPSVPESANRLSRAIQYPMTDAGWPDRVLTAYVLDAANARAAQRDKDRQP